MGESIKNGFSVFIIYINQKGIAHNKRGCRVKEPLTNSDFLDFHVGIW